MRPRQSAVVMEAAGDRGWRETLAAPSLCSVKEKRVKTFRWAIPLLFCGHVCCRVFDPAGSCGWEQLHWGHMVLCDEHGAGSLAGPSGSVSALCFAPSAGTPQLWFLQMLTARQDCAQQGNHPVERHFESFQPLF